MTPKTIAPPATTPITLADVKTRLSITDALEDTEIPALIQAAVEQAESYTERSFITRTLELAVDHFPVEIELLKGPVQSITSIKYLDSDGTEQTLSGSNYVLDDYSPLPWVLLAAGESWPATYDAANAVKIRYVAGFGDAADVPEDIKSALYIAVGHWIKFQSEVESGIGPSRMPRQFYDLLERHRITKF